MIPHRPGSFTTLLIPLAALLAASVLPVCAEAQAQTKMVAKPARMSTPEPEVASLCNPRTIESSSRGGRSTFTCVGQPPKPRPGTQVAAPTNKPRSEINCNYSEKDGVKTWLGCNCTANDDGNCNQFISWCAENGDEVGGNSGSATCMPGG